MLLILAGYGVGLAAASLIPAVSASLRRWYIVASPPALIPSFAAMAIVYAWYPWDYTGEWVEVAMGLAFLSAAFLLARIPEAGGYTRRVGAATLASVVFAAATGWIQAAARPSDSVALTNAAAEIDALVEDFAGPKLHTRCGIHKRLYTFVRDYGQTHLLFGEFAERLRAAGEYDRANYLLDPWNSPYWLRHTCSGDRESVFVYSFGPDRQRDSDEWQVIEDDVGKALKE